MTDGVVEYRPQDGSNDTITAGAERTGEKRGLIDGHGNVHPSSDNSTSEEQGGRQHSPITSVPGSEARYDP
jgi:hypothetical protein